MKGETMVKESQALPARKPRCRPATQREPQQTGDGRRPGGSIELEAALRKRIHGEVRFDAGSRALYATDLSIYRQVPIGVVIPRTVEDVITTVNECRKRGVPIL